jgi:hypothetical protein
MRIETITITVSGRIQNLEIRHTPPETILVEAQFNGVDLSND